MTNRDISGRTCIITKGMKEFIGATGTISHKEGKMWRISFYPAIEVAGVGSVKDDIWERSGFKVIKD